MATGAHRGAKVAEEVVQRARRRGPAAETRRGGRGQVDVVISGSWSPRFGAW